MNSDLLQGLLLTTLGSRAVGDAMHGRVIDKDIIFANLVAFLSPLKYFYWGIQVGRKLAAQQAQALDFMERKEKK